MVHLLQQASSTDIKCPTCKTATDCNVSTGKFIKFLSPVVHLDRLWCPSCGKKFYARTKPKAVVSISR